MTPDHAHQIAALLNARNQLSSRLVTTNILEEGNDYIVETRGDVVVGCVRTKRVQWYQFELSHLVVREEYERQGLGRALIERAEYRASTPVIQCTIRADNGPSLRLFQRCGYQQVNRFANAKTGNTLLIHQKVCA